MRLAIFGTKRELTNDSVDDCRGRENGINKIAEGWQKILSFIPMAKYFNDLPENMYKLSCKFTTKAEERVAARGLGG